jgi:hypothetical protein
VEEGGLSKAIALLSSMDFQVQRWACNAIGIICTDNLKNQETVGRVGGIKPLVECLKSIDPQVQRWSVFAIGNVAYCSTNNAYLF